MTQAITNKKPPYLLMYIVTLVYLVVTAFFEEGVAYFDPVYTTLMSATEFYLTFSLCVVLFLTVTSIAKHYFGIRINWVFFSLVVMLFLIDVVAILLFPEWTVLTGVYHLTTSLRIRYIIFWLAACMAFYVFFAIMPKSVKNVRDWNFYFLGAIVIALSACFYSYFKESSSYLYFFDQSKDFNNYVAPVSFTNNRNTYGTLLMIGVLSSLYLFKKSRNVFFPIISIFFFINLLFSFSKTSILCALIAIIVFAFDEYVCTVKSHPVISSFAIVLFVFCLLFPLFVKKITFLSGNHFFSRIISNNFIFFDYGNPVYFDSLDERIDILSDIFVLCSKNIGSLFFGFGDWNFSWYLGFCRNGSSSYIESAHSGLFDVFGRSGLIGVVLYLGLIIYFFIIALKNYKARRNGAAFSLTIFICVLLHGYFEDTNFLNMQAKPMMFLFMAFMPMLTDLYFGKKANATVGWEKEYASSNCEHHLIQSRGIDVSYVSCLIATPIVSVLLGLSTYFSVWRGALLLDTLFFFLQISVVFILFPFIVYFSFQHKYADQTKRFRLYAFLGAFWSLGYLLISFFAANLLIFSLFSTIGLLIMLTASIGTGKKDFRHFLSYFISFLLISIVLISMNKFVVGFFMIKDEIFQPYAAMCLVIFDIIIPLLITITPPLHGALFCSLDDLWQHIEDKYLFLGYRYQVRFEIRLMKATNRKSVLRGEK
jgi:hypothetical protein